MTTDDGGWMLIGVAQLAAETNVAATIVRSKGDFDGIANRCDDNVHNFWFDDAKGQRASDRDLEAARNAWWKDRDIYVK